MKYLTKYFMKYFAPKNFTKFYITGHGRASVFATCHLTGSRLEDLKRSIAFVTINPTGRYELASYVRSITDSTQLASNELICIRKVLDLVFALREAEEPIPVARPV